MSHLGIFKLEDRVLFDAAGAAEVVEAASNVDNHSQVSESQVQDNEAKDALKNAPPENPADAAVQQQVQQATPENVADLDAAADAIVDGEIVPGDNPVDADAADAADAGDHAAPAVEAHADAADADDISADDDGGDVQAADTADGIDAIQHADLGDDIDDFINLDQDAEQDSDGDSPVALDGGAVAADADAPQRDLVIINSSVQNKEQIVEALGENTDVLYLEAGTDPLDAINDFLDANGDVKYSAIHIVSHGNAGYFVLNGQIIDADAVMSDPASWANIGQHMTADGDIMIYGCNVAGSLDGEMLISNIANLTGADVAASVDDTGARGDWDLEYTVGTIDNPFLDASDYGYTLESYTVTNGGSVTTDGSLEYQLNAAIEAGDTDAEFVLQADSTIYGNWTISSDSAFTFSGADYTITINSDAILQVDGTATFETAVTHNGVIRGGGTVNFSGATAGSGVINTLTTTDAEGNSSISSLSVTYAGSGDVFGGTYKTLTLNNSEARTLAGNVTVQGNTYFNGTLNSFGYDFTSNGALYAQSAGAVIDAGLGDITLSQGVNKDSIDNLQIQSSGTVTYGAGASGISDGSYHDLVFNGSSGTINSGVQVSGEISGTGSLTIAVDLSTAGASIHMTGGIVSYESGIPVLEGTYNNLSFTSEGDWTWSDFFEAGKNYTISNQLSILGNGNILFDVAVADTVTLQSVRVYGNAIYSNAFLTTRNPFSGSYYGNVTIGDGAFEKNLVLTDMELNGAYLDLTNLSTTSTITFAGVSTYQTNFQMRVASGLDTSKVIYASGDNTIFQLYSSADGTSWTQVAYNTLTLEGGTNSVSGTISVTDRLIMGRDASLQVNGGANFSLGNEDATAVMQDSGAYMYWIYGNAEFHVANGANIRGGYYVGPNGNLLLNVSGSQLSGGVQVSGGTVELAGSDTTYNCNVGLSSSGGTLNVTGSNLTFNFHFTNAMGWYDTADVDGYNPFDNRDYIANSDNDGLSGQLGSALTSGNYDGVINIKSDGIINFNGQVVSVGEFNIESGTINFSVAKLVAVAGGAFTILGGEVTFNGNVYISAAFNSPRDTTFTVTDGTVVFNADVQNWVRTYRGGSYKTEDGALISFGDMMTYTVKETEYSGLNLTRNATSSVVFSGGKVSFGGGTTFRNYGVFGTAELLVESGASVKFNEVRNFHAAAYSPYPVTNPGTITWSSAWVAEYGQSSPFVSTIQGVARGGVAANATLTLDSSNLTFSGDVINSGFSGMGRAFLYLEGSNNTFSSTVSNLSGAWLEINGSGNKFDAFTNSGNSFAYVNAQSSFATVTNSSLLYFTDAKATQIDNFTNTSGAVILAGDNAGFKFVESMNIVAGDVTINSALEVPLQSDITLGSNATLTITAVNTLEGDITNNGTLTLAGRGVTLKGDLVNNNIFNLTAVDDASILLTVLEGSITNSKSGVINISQAGLVFNQNHVEGALVNAGKLIIAQQVTFNNLENQATGLLEFTSVVASGTVFEDLTNAGTITITADNVEFRGTTTNTGTLTIAAAAFGSSFQKIDNSGKLYLYGGVSGTTGVDNSGYIQVRSGSETVLSNVVNNSGATIESTAFGSTATMLTLAGTLVNNGILTGTGGIKFTGSTTGSGKVTSTGEIVFAGDSTTGQNVAQTFYQNGSTYTNVTIEGGKVDVNFNLELNQLLMKGGMLNVLEGFTLGVVDYQSIGSGSSGVLDVDGTMVFRQGTSTAPKEFVIYEKVDNAGRIEFGNNISVKFAGETVGNGLLIMNGGTLTYSGSEQYLFNTGNAAITTVLEGGMKYIGYDMTMSLTNNGANMTVVNGVTLTLGKVSGNGAYTIFVQDGATLKVGGNSTGVGAIQNDGLVDITVNAGEAISLENGITNNSEMNIVSNGSLQINGTVTNNADGELNITSGGSVMVGGTVSNGGTLNVAGTVGFSGAVNNSNVLNLNSGNITVGGLLTNSGTVNAYAGALTGVENNATFNVEADGIVLGAFTNNGALNFNTDFGISDATFGKPSSTVELGGDIYVAAGKTLSISMAEQLRFTGVVNVAEGSTFHVYSLGSGYDTDNATLGDGGVYVATLNNAGEVLVQRAANLTAGEAVLEINNVASNTGRLTALDFGVLLLSQTASDVPGEVYVQGGQIYYAGNVPDLSIWFTIAADSEKSVSDFAGQYDFDTGNYGFLILGKLTVDTADGGMFLYNVQDGGTLTFAVDSNVTESVAAAEGGTIEVNDGIEVTFSGVTSGDGTIDAAGKVTYAGVNGTGFGGTYDGGLSVTGDNVTFHNAVSATDTEISGGAVFNAAVAVADLLVGGNAVFNSTMNATGAVGGTGNVTFNGAATAAGGAAMGAGSQVTYNAGSAQVIDGSYDSLTLNGAHTMNNATVNGTAAINGSVTSSGTLNFGASGNVVAGADGAINSTGQVVYAGTGDVVSGSYNQLTISGSDQTAGDVTVNGSLQYTGSGLDVNGVFTNNGTVELDGNPANFNNTVINNGAFDVAGDANQFTGDFVNNKTLEVSGDDNVFFRVTNNGEFTLSGDHNFFSAVSNQRNFAITGDGNRIVSFTNTAITNINGSDNSFGSINNTGNGIIYKDGQMWMVSGVGGVGDGFPDEYNLNFSSLAMLLGNELRAAELQELFLAGDDSPFVFRRRISRIPDGIDDLALALESEFDELQLETLDDVTAFDAADFQDGDYADIMDSADVFTDTVDEAIAEMAAV